MSRKPGYKNPNAGRRKIPLIMELPEKQIIFEQVMYWIDLQATQEEIAGSFHVSVETLNGRLMDHFGLNFTDLRKRCDGAAKLSLRRYQFQQAKTKPNMAIWLGKQWLGQKDKEDDSSIPPNDANLTLLGQMISENRKLRERLNALESKTDRVDSNS